MTEQMVKVRETVQYGGHSLRASGAVDITFAADYSELTNTVQVMQMLNNDVTIKAKVPGAKAMRLGTFRVKSITVADDGTSKLKFNGLNDFIEMDNLNSLPLKTDDVSLFAIMMEAVLDLEDDEGGDGDGGWE